MVDLEIEMADISDNKKILHIGCGSIPATAILLAKKTNNSITAIDNDYSSTERAKKTINFFNLKDKISIIHSDGYNFSINNFDIIILSLGINPGYKIMKRISNLITKDIKLIYRTSSNFEGNLSDNDSFLKNFFKIEKIIHHNKNGLLISVFLSKLNQSN
jgi:tRNA1(Val) A37 N6-methylase TrmN6